MTSFSVFLMSSSPPFFPQFFTICGPKIVSVGFWLVLSGIIFRPPFVISLHLSCVPSSWLSISQHLEGLNSASVTWLYVTIVAFLLFPDSGSASVTSWSVTIVAFLLLSDSCSPLVSWLYVTIVAFLLFSDSGSAWLSWLYVTIVVFFCSQTQALTPDGHRAPIADLLNMRSVNTQTPSGGPFHSGIEKHFLRILEDSSDDSPCLPIIPGAGDAPLLFNRPASTESDRSDQCDLRPVSGKGRTDCLYRYGCMCACM